jgi:hypothetical protein
MAFAPSAYYLPKTAATKLERYLSAMRSSAEKQPVSYSLAQLSGATGSGLGGGIATGIDPESPGLRLAFEVVGGYLSPGRILVNGTTDAINFGKTVASNVSRSAREERAGAVLRAYLIEAGDDPDEVIRLLSKPFQFDAQGNPIAVTAGQKTGLPSLNALEATLASAHPKYSKETTKQGQSALQAYKLIIDRMRDIGTPAFLTKAAELEAQLFDSTIQSRLDLAYADAAATAARISNDTPAVRAQLGQVVQDNVKQALQQAREVEKQLWTDALRSTFVKQKVPIDYNAMEVPDRLNPNFTIYMKGEKGTVVKESYDPKSVKTKSAFEYVKETVGDPNPQSYNFSQDAFNKLRELRQAGIEEVVDLSTNPKRIRTVLPAKETVVSPRMIPTDNFNKTFLDFVSSITPERYQLDFPPALRAMAERMGIESADLARYQKGMRTVEFVETGKVPAEYLPKDLDNVAVDDLIRIRSDMLSYAREAAGRGEVSNAALYGRLGEAILDDLSGQLKSSAYDKARAYSRSLNDVFSRSFANDITAPTPRGGERLPAEILVSRAFGRNADVTAMRMDEIEGAVDFIRQQYDDVVKQYGPRSSMALMLRPLVPDSKKGVASIRDAQSRVLRLAALQTVNPEGRVDANRLSRFITENDTVLTKLGIKNDLTDAVRAENTFKLVTQDSAVARATRDQEAFAQVLKFGNPTDAVTDALRSRFPLKNFQGIVQLAKDGGPSAINGLKSTLYDYAITSATSRNGQFSPAIFEKTFFEKLAPNQPSIYEIMRAQGLMTMSEGKNLRRLVEPLKRIEQNLVRGEISDQIMPGSSPITDLALRVIGAKIGTELSPGGPGSLIAASAGSKAVRSVFDKMPALSLTRLIEQATRDPELMAMLLKKAPTPKEAFRLQKQLNSFLIAAGFNYAMPDEPLVPEEALRSPVTGPTASQMLRQLPPGPPTRGVPGLTTAQGPGPAKPPAGGAPQPQSRAMLQSLFPFDTTLSAGLPRQ